MKYLAKSLFLLSFVALGACSTTSAQTHTAAGPVDLGPQDTAIHRPTPTPAPAGQTAVADNTPLTAKLAKDNEGKTATTVFSTSDPKVYVVWKDGASVKGNTLRVAWYAEDTGGAMTKNKKLTEVTKTFTGPGSFGAFYLPATASGFPAGKYRADLYEGSKLSKSLKFTVAKK